MKKNKLRHKLECRKLTVGWVKDIIDNNGIIVIENITNYVKKEFNNNEYKLFSEIKNIAEKGYLLLKPIQLIQLKSGEHIPKCYESKLALKILYNLPEEYNNFEVFCIVYNCLYDDATLINLMDDTDVSYNNFYVTAYS